MCGIAGVIKWGRGEWNPGARGSLDAMLAAIAHRGPDGSGQWVDPRPGHRAALLHTRLAIIDKAGGHQPMGNEDGRVQVVFNGEIYNHAELRQELIVAGHHFASDHSDTEVLVHGWEQWGADLPQKLLGMFAFAIWDSANDTLFLARDRMGQKPLFYAPLDDGIVFGSTIGSVLAWPEVPRRVPREQVGLYLQLGYLPPPMTIYRDLSQVMPGHFVRARGDVVDGGNYWIWKSEDLRPKSRIVHTMLRNEIEQAVESQLMADVPVACFLSGGVDSTIIASVMQEAMRKHGGDAVQTISVGFGEAEFDETQYAAMVAKKIGSRHSRLEVDAGKDPIGTLTMLMERVLGQPFADSSILPTHHLSVATRGIAPVALSGDGGDELFGGYDRYRAMIELDWWRHILRMAPRSLPLGSTRRRERWRRLAKAARAKSPAERYTRLVEIFPREGVLALLGHIEDWTPEAEEFGLAAHARVEDYAMRRDQAEYLPGDLLCKVDSAAMAVALEVRSPFLDHRVVELARAIPAGVHMGAGRAKLMLKLAFHGELPEEIGRRRKQGFAVPIGEWFRGNLRAPLHDFLTSSDSFSQAHLHHPTIDRLLAEHQSGQRDHTHRLFSLLMLEIWWRQAGAILT